MESFFLQFLTVNNVTTEATAIDSNSNPNLISNPPRRMTHCQIPLVFFEKMVAGAKILHPRSHLIRLGAFPLKMDRLQPGEHGRSSNLPSSFDNTNPSLRERENNLHPINQPASVASRLTIIQAPMTESTSIGSG